MAKESVIYLKVESKFYDDKIKRATEGIKHFEEECRTAGKSLDQADKKTLDYVKALGDMGTVAKTAKGQLREYTNALNDLTSTYKAMSDAEKNSEFGKAMSASIEQIKVKAADLQDQIGDLNEELKHMASDTAFTDGINLMTRTIGASASAIVAWTGDSKEMEAVIKDLAKIGTTVAAVDQLTKAFQKQNLVLLKNPYVAAAAAIGAVGIAIAELVKKSQELSAVEQNLADVSKQGRENSAKEITRIEMLNNILHDNTRSLQERKNALSEIQALVPDYHGALTEEGNLINDNSDALTAYINNLQRAATAQAAFDRMVELQKQKLEAQVQLQEAQGELKKAEERVNRPVTPAAAAAQAGSGRNAYAAAMESDIILLGAAKSKVTELERQVEEFNTQITALQDLVKSSDIVTVTGGTNKSVNTKPVKENDEPVLPKGSIAALRKELADANKAYEMKTTDEGRASAKARVEELTAALEKLTGVAKTASKEVSTVVTGAGGYSQEGIGGLRNDIQNQMASMQIGSKEYIVQAERLVDLKAFENLLQTAVQNGIVIPPQLLEDTFEKIDVGIGVSDDDWKTFVDDLNARLAELNLPPIQLDIQTGNVKELTQDVRTMNMGWMEAASAISQVGSAMQGLKDPSAKIAGMVAQAVASVALGLGAAIEHAGTEQTAGGPWGWIAFAISATATMLATVASIAQATQGFAEGGMVGGNSYSGDNIVARLNSGEGVLTATGIENAAEMASNVRGPIVQVTGKLRGKDLLLVADNYNASRGGSRGAYANVKM